MITIEEVNEYIPYNDIDDLRNLARTINQLIQRAFTGSVTFSETTTISDSRIATTSQIFLTPKNSTAQSASYYITPAEGSFTITHDANGAEFDYVIYR